MDTVYLDTKHDASSVHVPAPAPVPATNTVHSTREPDPPADWPLQLQVAIVFWVAIGTVLAFAMSSGAAWLWALIPIAADYVWYLRTDRGLTVEFLSDATWNRPAGIPSPYAPQESWRDALPSLPAGKAEPFKFRDLDVRATLKDARDDITSHFAAVRRRFRFGADRSDADTSAVSRSESAFTKAPAARIADASMAWRDAA